MYQIMTYFVVLNAITRS